MKQTQSVQVPVQQRKLLRHGIVLYASLFIGVIVLVSGLALVSIPNDLINSCLKSRITKSLAGAYPSYSIQFDNLYYNIWENRVQCDSVTLTAIDSGFSCTITAFNARGIQWSRLFRGESLTPASFSASVIEANNIVVVFPQTQYELRCKRFIALMRDSEIVAEAFELHPLAGDEQFFAKSKFRRTRFRMILPECQLSGISCPELLEGTMYRARSVQIYEAFLDVLINKDKPRFPKLFHSFHAGPDSFFDNSTDTS